MTMRAWMLIGHGGMDMLQLREDCPRPVAGSEEVLVRVLACGLNNTDVNTRTGWYSAAVTGPTTGQELDAAGDDDASWGGVPLTLPRIQGADVCGIVEEAGCGAGRDLVGKRVLIDPWIRDWRDPGERERIGYFGSETDGGFAEYACVHHRQVHAIDSDMTDAELATFATGWGTALYMLERVTVGEGDTVLVTGASGGVGSALVQLAKLRQARVVGICSPEKADILARTGTDAVIRRQAGNLKAAIEAAIPGRITVVADLVGGTMFRELIDLLAPGGRYVVAGAIGGPCVQLDLRTLYLRDLRFAGVTIPAPGAFARLVDIIESGRVRPVLAAEYGFEELPRAQQAFIDKRHVGNIVITM